MTRDPRGDRTIGGSPSPRAAAASSSVRDRCSSSGSVALGRGCMASSTVAPRSDGEGELGEGSREPMPGMNVGGKLVVAAAQVLDEGVPRTDHLYGPEPFQAAHGSQPGLQFAVIGFDHIIRILLEDMQGGGQQLIEYPEVGRRLVGGHLGWVWAVLECLGEEPTGGRQISFLCGADVNDLAEL